MIIHENIYMYLIYKSKIKIYYKFFILKNEKFRLNSILLNYYSILFKISLILQYFQLFFRNIKKNSEKKFD